MMSWREAILLCAASGFAWYLFLAPQQGAGSVDNRAKNSLEQGQVALETAGSAAAQAARSLLN